MSTKLARLAEGVVSNHLCRAASVARLHHAPSISGSEIVRPLCWFHRHLFLTKQEEMDLNHQPVGMVPGLHKLYLRLTLL